MTVINEASFLFWSGLGSKEKGGWNPGTCLVLLGAGTVVAGVTKAVPAWPDGPRR